jgi:DOPA 4,5-dioxygenase
MDTVTKNNFSKYHVHVYCDLDQVSVCQQVRRELLSSGLAIEGAGPVRNRPIGPHPKPMFEAWFASSELDSIIDWMKRNRNGLSVMFHPLSGDDLADHKDYSFWIGEKLKLDLTIF